MNQNIHYTQYKNTVKIELLNENITDNGKVFIGNRSAVRPP